MQFSFMNRSDIDKAKLTLGLMPLDEGPCCYKILIVDDNPFNVKSLQLMLQYCFQMPCDIVIYFLFKAC